MTSALKITIIKNIFFLLTLLLIPSLVVFIMGKIPPKADGNDIMGPDFQFKAQYRLIANNL